ncbi:MAG: tetratricopeptide repeat protein [Proteobacteria bacterium]|nr:tetratricopeptide repeat protein [Pseudomonadota bacterium]
MWALSSPMLQPTTIPQPVGRPYALSVCAVAMLWSEARTGTLIVGSDRFVLVDGEAADLTTLEGVVAAMYTDQPMWFVDEPHAHEGRLHRLAPALWRAATRLGDRSRLAGRGCDLVRAGAAYDRLAELPVSDDARDQFSFVDSSDVEVGDTGHLTHGRSIVVLSELTALCELGILRLEHVPAQETEFETGGTSAFGAGVRACEAGDHERAIACLREAAAGDNSARVSAWLGFAFFQAPDLRPRVRRALAEAHLERASASEPDCPDIAYLRARLLVQDEEFLRAWSLLDGLLRTHPWFPGAEGLLNEARRGLTMPA